MLVNCNEPDCVCTIARFYNIEAPNQSTITQYNPSKYASSALFFVTSGGGIKVEGAGFVG